MNKILSEINSVNDIKALSDSQVAILCKELRSLLLTDVSLTGGHLSANLGAVELTVAILRCFNPPDDKIVFDVGHQSYCYKILTGRADRFTTLRKKGGLCGFPRPSESEYDAFATGHSSTSVSAALGIAAKTALDGKKDFTVAVIGDGALTGGLAYEGLNNAGRYKSNLIVVLNDNGHSINQNVGALSQYLAKLTNQPRYFEAKDKVKKTLLGIPYIGEDFYKIIKRTKQMAKGAVSGATFFEQLGFTYFGPIDGHDVKAFSDVLERAKMLGKPSFIHLKTKKGKGYLYAEESPQNYHGVGHFDIKSGEMKRQKVETFSGVFGKTLCELAEHDRNIIAITAAMTDGVGLSAFAEKFKDRYFDVGIAESHAVTFAAGLAIKGAKPVVAIYSTFLQRAYDQIVHDCCIQNLPVVFAVDRAGLVGEDGETHQGIFDVPMMLSAPNMTIYAPKNFKSLKKCLKSAVFCKSPCAVRYPRGGEARLLAHEAGEYLAYYGEDEAKVVFVTYGRAAADCEKAATVLNKQGVPAGVVEIERIKPLDFDSVYAFVGGAEKVIFVEESQKIGGVAELFGLLSFQRGARFKYKIAAIDDIFVEQATTQQQFELCGLDRDSLVKAAMLDE